VDKAFHGLCPLDRSQETPRVSWIDRLRILLGQTFAYSAHHRATGDAGRSDGREKRWRRWGRQVDEAGIEIDLSPHSVGGANPYALIRIP
jgi:hypothetical protein